METSLLNYVSMLITHSVHRRSRERARHELFCILRDGRMETVDERNANKNCLFRCEIKQEESRLHSSSLRFALCSMSSRDVWARRRSKTRRRDVIKFMLYGSIILDNRLRAEHNNLKKLEFHDDEISRRSRGSTCRSLKFTVSEFSAAQSYVIEKNSLSPVNVFLQCLSALFSRSCEPPLPLRAPKARKEVFIET